MWNELNWLLVPVKAYVLAFPLGLVDLHFSKTDGVLFKICAVRHCGAALFSCCLLINAFFGLSDSVTGY